MKDLSDCFNPACVTYVFVSILCDKKTSNTFATKPDYTICFIFVLVLASEYVVE